LAGINAMIDGEAERLARAPEWGGATMRFEGNPGDFEISTSQKKKRIEIEPCPMC
jgi:hypothetical protein